MLSNTATDPSPENFLEYVEAERKHGTPDRVQLVFERGLKLHALDASLWAAYCQYVDEAVPLPDVVLAVHERSVRNCTWVGDLWLLYAVALERQRKPLEQCAALCERALATPLQSQHEYVEVWRTYAEIFFRHALQVKRSDDAGS